VPFRISSTDTISLTWYRFLVSLALNAGLPVPSSVAPFTIPGTDTISPVWYRFLVGLSP
jgi:hypothetical protein